MFYSIWMVRKFVSYMAQPNRFSLGLMIDSEKIYTVATSQYLFFRVQELVPHRTV